jgi:hypothetical protein
MRVLRNVALMLSALAAVPATAEPLRDGYPPAIRGLIYKDDATSVIVYVETDGRHVVAISPDGKILWRKDPFVDAGLEPYREPHPTIVFIGSSGRGCALRAESIGKVFCLSFSSSQFGVVDIVTGKFTPEGQN